jgi:hypothetical protein
VPWTGEPDEAEFAGAIRSAAKHLPLQYQETYVGPLLRNASTVLAQTPSLAEALAGAVYDHGADSSVVLPLRRFMAVISNLYRSFLWEQRRAEAKFPIVQQLPPLPTFDSGGGLGPFTLNWVGDEFGVRRVPRRVPKVGNHRKLGFARSNGPQARVHRIVGAILESEV